MPNKTSTFKAYDRLYGDWLPNDKNAEILDIGAGLGLVVAWLREAGFRGVTGIEPSGEQCEVALKYFGTQLTMTKDIQTYLSENPSRFDVVFLTDVIEHIPKIQIATYIGSISRVLKPGGSLILRTENMASPIGAFQYRMDFTHEYCFTEMSLRQVLSTVGFENIVIRGEPCTIGPPPGSAQARPSPLAVVATVEAAI